MPQRFYSIAFCFHFFFLSLLSISSGSAAPSLNTKKDPQLENHGTILQYHHVSDTTPKITSVTPEQLISHLGLIKSMDFEVLPLQQLMSEVKNKKPSKLKRLAITFDDGYDSIYDNAFPLLKQYNWPFTIFVNPNSLAKGSQLNWQQLKEMMKHGATIANHSSDHKHLLKYENGESKQDWYNRIISDISMAQNILEDKLDIKNKWLAYPYGEFDDQLKTLLKELGYLGFSQQSGAVHHTTDMQAIPRFPASGVYANVKTLKTKLNSLPFSILSEQPPANIQSTESPAPILELEVDKQDINVYSLQCYFSGKTMEIEKIVKKKSIVIKAQHTAPLPSGRSRYNCTAQSLSQKRHYWYSMPFITLNKQGKWLN